MLDEDELEPQPITRAVIRWLRRHPPPPAQKLSVVHADYRTGNFLFDAEGEIRAILDWEMAHLGDPLEDLAWGINAVWMWSRDGLAGSLLPKADAIRIWEEASGLSRRSERAALVGAVLVREGPGHLGVGRPRVPDAARTTTRCSACRAG